MTHRVAFPTHRNHHRGGARHRERTKPSAAPAYGTHRHHRRKAPRGASGGSLWRCWARLSRIQRNDAG